jgi:hypothetical protein
MSSEELADFKDYINGYGNIFIIPYQENAIKSFYWKFPDYRCTDENDREELQWLLEYMQREEEKAFEFVDGLVDGYLDAGADKEEVRKNFKDSYTSIMTRIEEDISEM